MLPSLTQNLNVATSDRITILVHYFAANHRLRSQLESQIGDLLPGAERYFRAGAKLKPGVIPHQQVIARRNGVELEATVGFGSADVALNRSRTGFHVCGPQVDGGF